MTVDAAEEAPEAPARPGIGPGAPATFEQFVHAHADRLTRLALLLTGDRAADDAVQEALARACPRWERIARADDPLAYVRRMVVNAHHTWWRSVGRRERPSAALPEAAYDDEAGGPDPELWALCRGLPERQRAVVVLRFYEGLSTAEIAGVLGVTEATVRSQQHRALAALRTALTARGQEDER